MMSPALYADIVFPYALPAYTYAVPTEWTDSVRIGQLVQASLGTRCYTGMIVRLRTEKPQANIKYKSFTALLSPSYLATLPLDETLKASAAIQAGVLATAEQIQSWEWMAEYYCCTLGEVYRAAMPTLLHKREYKPLQTTYVYRTEVELPKYTSQQQNLLQRFTELTTCGSTEPQEKLPVSVPITTSMNTIGVAKADLLQGQSMSSFKTLVAKGVLTTKEQDKSRLLCAFMGTDLSPLTPAQEKAFTAIQDQFKEHPVVLLHGVTSSGKTEIYMQLIAQVLAKGGQVLYLVPEIGLTTQLTDRLQRVFGNRLISYHSKLNDAERAEIYLQQLSNEPFDIVLGVRSSVFLPFKNLQLVIVDEEHETSYKQFEPAPRYHAKNAALALAHFAGAPAVLGSATPSLESYAWAQAGKYGLVNLQERYQAVEMPEIHVIDRQDAFKKNRMKEMFSWFLMEKMQDTLAAGEQVILFQNRRGFSSYLECTTCAYTPKCPHCDVSLTYHKAQGQLVCHYCGYTQAVPHTCPQCGNETIKEHGYGTERVVEALHTYFPTATVARMDVDSTRNKTAYQDMLQDFATGKTQILVGTQMVAKGLDFEQVGLVGILNADNLLNYPDFRATERAYQLMVQVAGRAGRRKKRGCVVLQTAQVDHSIMPAVVHYDYAQFYQAELQERNLFQYPPYVRLIAILVKGKQENVVNQAINALAKRLQATFGAFLLGPYSPPVGKVNQNYLQQLLIKIKTSPAQAKVAIRKAIAAVKKQYSAVSILVDVDPM